jgi:hypothetical protein
MTTEEKPDQREPVVFIVRRDTQCAECGEERWHGSAITLRDGKALCLECAELDHMDYLPRGNAALTRRARKHSRVSIAVVQWSRTRKQYERQGFLVEPGAIEKAEEEFAADADARARQQERRAARAAELDAAYVTEFARHVRQRWPGCPEKEAQQIAEHACRKYTGRVGRSAAAKRFDPEATDLAVRAHIRHAHTRYDELLFGGWDREDARYAVAGGLAEVEGAWAAKG